MNSKFKYQQFKLYLCLIFSVLNIEILSPKKADFTVHNHLIYFHKKVVIHLDWYLTRQNTLYMVTFLLLSLIVIQILPFLLYLQIYLTIFGKIT